MLKLLYFILFLFYIFPYSLLPPQFPQDKPVVSVYPPVGHHLVDSNNGSIVTSSLITNVSTNLVYTDALI